MVTKKPARKRAARVKPAAKPKQRGIVTLTATVEEFVAAGGKVEVLAIGEVRPSERLRYAGKGAR